MGIDERESRIKAANAVNRILVELGGLSALVPRGPLRDRVDAAADLVGDLADAIGAWKPGSEEGSGDAGE